MHLGATLGAVGWQQPRVGNAHAGARSWA